MHFFMRPSSKNPFENQDQHLKQAAGKESLLLEMITLYSLVKIVVSLQ